MKKDKTTKASLSPKQKDYIDKHISSDSIKSIASHLGVDVRLVRKYAGQTILSAKKPYQKILFYLTLAIIPIFFLIGFEMTLRLTHYGTDLSLVLTKEINGQRYYQINRHVARRYFSSDEVTVPDARSEVFEYRKSPNTYRIFCLGGSTTAGWPFQFNATFPGLLHDRLKILFPDRHFEVINVGISAINSFSVLDFTKELVRYHPDLFLIYMGHNEFYGALGVASTQSIATNRTLIKLYLSVEKFKIFQLLRDAISHTKSFLHHSQSGTSPHSLMEMMAADKYIPLDSYKYNLAKSYFRQNLVEVLETIKKKHVLVIVGTLVSNLKDQEPFQSVFSETFRARDRWDQLYSQGLELEQGGDHTEAIDYYLKAAKLDSTPARLFYHLGRCFQALGNSQDALRAFKKARDLDALRFRAPSEFNDIIRQVCSSEHVPVAEINQAFAARSPDGIIGHELIIEHLHPNANGYLLLADTFCRTMGQMGLIVSAEKWPWQRDMPEEELLKQAYVTDIDVEIANERIRFLTSHWPFKEQVTLRQDGGTEYDRLLKQTVAALFRRDMSWNEAHYRMGEYWMKLGRYDRAEREYRAVIKVTPTNYYPYIYLGNVLLAQNNRKGAEDAYKKALIFSPTLPYAYAKLGMLYMTKNDPERAKPVLEKAVSLGLKTSGLSNREMANARYLLAVAYAQLNDFGKAKEQAQIALRLIPGDKRIRTLLVKLQTVMMPDQ